MAPVPLNIPSPPRPFGIDPNYSYGESILTKLFTTQPNDWTQEGAIRSRLCPRSIHRRPSQKESSSVSLKCDVALGCSMRESHPASSRRNPKLSINDAFTRDRRIHASKKKIFQQQERDRALLKTLNVDSEDEDHVVYRVCQYSTGSRYGYLVDHCPDPLSNAPSDSHFSRAPQFQQEYSSHNIAGRAPGVRVDLTFGTITLALILLLLVAIMIVEVIDVICNAREASAEDEARGRSRTRRRLLVRKFMSRSKAAFNDKDDREEKRFRDAFDSDENDDR